jgi:hypothetical protein
MQKALQFESIDDELRNRVWSALKIAIWDNWSPPTGVDAYDTKTELVESLVACTAFTNFLLTKAAELKSPLRRTSYRRTANVTACPASKSIAQP